MNNFVVPQFIDVEDKILGPITVRQFVTMLTGAILIFICYKLLTTAFFVVALLLIGGMVFLFGFLKINGRPFVYFVLNVIKIYKTPRIRVWRRDVTSDDLYLIRQREKEKTEKDEEGPKKRQLESSTLAELALVVNTGGAYGSSGDVAAVGNVQPGKTG